MTRGRWIVLAVAVASLLLLGRAFAELVVEQRWYEAFGPGAQDLWGARMAGLWLLRGSCALIAATLCFASLWGVVSSVDKIVLPRRLGDLEIGETVPGLRLLWGAAAVSLVVGALLSLPLDDWMSVIALGAGATFGEIDPYTEHDLAYHVHWLPLENSLYAWALLVLLSVAAITLASYALTPGLRMVRGRVRLSGHVRRHVTVLGVALLLLLAWGHRLDAFSLLVAGSGDAGAFTVADHRVGIPLRFGLAVMTALSSLVVLRAGWAGQPRLAFWVVTGVLSVTFVSRWLAPAIAMRMMPPEQLTRLQAAYAGTRALYTRRAFSTDRIALAPGAYGADSLSQLTRGASVWDPEVLVRALERVRRNGSAVANVGWAVGPEDALRAIVVERPAVVEPADAQPEWTVLTVDASRADVDGLPLAVTTDARPLSDAGRRVTMLVYPEAIGPAVVSDPGQQIVGDAVDGWSTRLAHAWAQRDLRIAFSSTLDRVSAPKLVLRRDPRARLQALAPFFEQSEALYPALVGDSLYWIVHLYAASAAYPLSQHYSVTGRDRSYFQHAAVGIVNAQSGAVRVVADSAPGAVARLWVARLPRLFTPTAQLPPALATAIPPATDAALVQAWTFAQFGARGAVATSPRRLTGGPVGDSTIGNVARPVVLLPVPPLVPSAEPAAARLDSIDPRPVVATPARVPAWTLPLLDAASRVDGVLVALGGPTPRTLWLPAPSALPRWPDLLDAAARDGGPARIVAERVGAGRGTVDGRRPHAPRCGRRTAARERARAPDRGPPRVRAADLRSHARRLAVARGRDGHRRRLRPRGRVARRRADRGSGRSG